MWKAQISSEPFICTPHPFHLWFPSVGFTESIIAAADWPWCDFGANSFYVDTVASLLFFLYEWNKMKNSLKTEEKNEERNQLVFLYLPAQKSNVEDWKQGDGKGERVKCLKDPATHSV